MAKLRVKDHTLVVLENQHQYELSTFTKAEVALEKVHKTAVATLLNATANALTRSIANGNELTNIYLLLYFDGRLCEKIRYNDEPIVRFSLEYHALIKEAREACYKIQRHYQKCTKVSNE